jgi:predicted SAM-dependent methyltransferase
LNTDLVPGPGVIYLDAGRPFPLPAETFDFVFSEHQIEHITLPKGRTMLRECFRILRPGGVVRIATPSLEAMVSLCGDELTETQRHYIETVTDTCVPNAGLYRGAVLVNNMFRNWGHRFIYDRATLRQIMEEVGFIDVTFCEVGDSAYAELRGIERHGEALGDESLNRLETMVVEGTRPTMQRPG